jgi:hypothetical protein
MGGPTSSYATTSIALRVSGSLKPHHHDKVGTHQWGSFDLPFSPVVSPYSAWLVNRVENIPDCAAFKLKSGHACGNKCLHFNMKLEIIYLGDIRSSSNTSKIGMQYGLTSMLFTTLKDKE